MAELRIGISGWTYAPWRGTFFPAGLAQRRELEYASRQVRSIEINGTFYSLQRAASYRAWFDATPDDFVFAVKGPRFITHLRRLRDVEVPLANFFASGVLQLGRKLGPLLWQFPPSFRYDPARLAAFFRLLPRDTRAAARLARRHDHRIREPHLRTDAPRPLRHAVEVRHRSFIDPAFIALLREHDIGLVVADTAGKWPVMEDVTSDFVYVRLHGDTELYVSGYTDEALRDWARRIRAWTAGREAPGARRASPARAAKADARSVYVYFDNDVKVRAPFDAMMLAHLLRQGPRPDNPPPVESVPEVARTSWPAWRRVTRRPGSKRTTTRTGRRAKARATAQRATLRRTSRRVTSSAGRRPTQKAAGHTSRAARNVAVGRGRRR